ncbi:HlyD family efflux transporter periplasmic adaptor subunit [bacterium]|nr:HlyD family efflux transporter periplasmic adaptor subunit [bacterium]
MKKLLFISFLLFVCCSPKTKSSVQTYKAKKGEFHINVVETGEVQATRSINISSPAMSWRFGALKITKIIDDGTEVAEGDTVIVFDPSEVQKAIIDANAELEIAKAELEKQKAVQDSKIQELEADLKVFEISHQISQIELELTTYESDVKKKEIRLTLEQAKISLDKAQDEIENQKNIHKEEQHQSELKIKQLVSNLAEANVTLKNLVIISRSAGVAIIRKNWSTGNKCQVGDQVWSGMPLIDLPDLRELKTETEINEVDISKIKLNQKVDIQLDAFSDTVYTGKVIEIAALAKYKDEEKKSKVKIFPVRILIEGTSKNLMPGITVSCKIIVDTIDNVLFIPLEAIIKDQNKDFVYLKNGDSYKKTEVKVGVANNDFIIVEKGLEEGDVIALSDPFIDVNKKKMNNNENKI